MNEDMSRLIVALKSLMLKTQFSKDDVREVEALFTEDVLQDEAAEDLMEFCARFSPGGEEYLLTEQDLRVEISSFLADFGRK